MVNESDCMKKYLLERHYEVLRPRLKRKSMEYVRMRPKSGWKSGAPRKWYYLYLIEAKGYPFSPLILQEKPRNGEQLEFPLCSKNSSSVTVRVWFWNIFSTLVFLKDSSFRFHFLEFDTIGLARISIFPHLFLKVVSKGRAVCFLHHFGSWGPKIFFISVQELSLYSISGIHYLIFTHVFDYSLKFYIIFYLFFGFPRLIKMCVLYFILLHDIFACYRRK